MTHMGSAVNNMSISGDTGYSGMKGRSGEKGDQGWLQVV